MAVQFSVAVGNARLDAIEATIGTSPILEIRTGSKPATCATADSGTVLATLTLPSDWLGAASSRTKSLAGTWEDTVADASGTAAHFRIKDSGGSTCHLQGTVTSSSGSGDITLSSASIVTGQPVSITGFTLSDGNA